MLKSRFAMLKTAIAGAIEERAADDDAPEGGEGR